VNPATGRCSAPSISQPLAFDPSMLMNSEMPSPTMPGRNEI
jgi:hypothetical protein